MRRFLTIKSQINLIYMSLAELTPKFSGYRPVTFVKKIKFKEFKENV